MTGAVAVGLATTTLSGLPIFVLVFLSSFLKVFWIVEEEGRGGREEKEGRRGGNWVSIIVEWECSRKRLKLT